MNFKNLFFLLFHTSLLCFSININNKNDTIENKKNYKWIITNTSELKLNIKNALNKHEIDSMLYIIAKNLENNGYPFAIIEFRYDSIKNKNFYGKVFIEKGNLTNIDSIAIKGYNKFPK